MHFNVVVKVIATVQRKANYNDKYRVRLKSLKDMAFHYYKVSTTAQIKYFLKLLGIKLDLRLTAAWDAIVFELRHSILGIVESLKVSSIPQIGVGALVIWDYPPGWGYYESWFPLRVRSIDGDMAYIEYKESPVPISELSLAA